MPARVVPLKNEAFALVWFHRDEVKSEYDDDWYGCVHPVEFYPGNMNIYHESLVSAGWEFGEVEIFDLFQLEGDHRLLCLLEDLLLEYSLGRRRSEEHTSDLPSLMRISYAVFSLTNKSTTPPK